MIETLQRLKDAGALDALDAAFGEWVGQWGGEPVALAGALASAEVGQGHVCLDFETAGRALRANGVAVPENWSNSLARSEAVTGPGGRAPLVLDGKRLYLHRYWCYESRIAAGLRELAASRPETDAGQLKKALHELFPAAGSGELDRQALAAAIGATRRLTVISGGPGTGKTTAVIKLVRLVCRLDADLAIALAAPTGKAASRLNDALAKGWPAEAGVRQITAQTLHRLLGYNAARQTIRHDANSPLPADIVVVDEASMVDIGLMARLVAALKPRARLVLVGDRDQLASVEAGAVFGDICSVADGFPPEAAIALESALGAVVPRSDGEVSPVSGSIALLKRNYRFGNKGIGALAGAVIAGDAALALDRLIPSRLVRGSASSSPSPLAGEDRVGKYNRKAVDRLHSHSHPSPLPSREKEHEKQTLSASENLSWHPLANERQLTRELERVARAHFAPVKRAASAEEALARLDRFRLLAAERRGIFGVEGINVEIESLLGVRPRDVWYRGRPVLITENDYELELYNGDFGIVWPDVDGRDKLWLTAAGGDLKSVSLARLPAHETAWALTVHKAQGSEFDRVALVLPPRDSKVATRELVYTGITRAREAVEVWATEPVFRAAVERRIRRASGLAARLVQVR